MNLLPFDNLPPHRPRQFVPLTIDLSDWTHIARLWDRLEARAAQCGTPSELERWLLDWSELSAALDEESSRRYIAMNLPHRTTPTLKRPISTSLRTSSRNSSRDSSSSSKLPAALVAQTVAGATATRCLTATRRYTSSCFVRKTCPSKQKRPDSASSIKN